MPNPCVQTGCQVLVRPVEAALKIAALDGPSSGDSARAGWSGWHEPCRDIALPGAGHTWSSYVAQEKLLSVCADAGLGSGRILAADLPTPQQIDVTFAAATHDVMIFSNAGPGITAAAAERLDATLVSHNVLRNDSLNATCVGVRLENGAQWAVPPERCLAMVFSVLQLAVCKQASPEQVGQILGSLQWYDLLRRQKLAVYELLYKFRSDASATQQQSVPNGVLAELLLGTVVGIVWLTDLRKPTLDMVCASDASTDFGFWGLGRADAS